MKCSRRTHPCDGIRCLALHIQRTSIPIHISSLVILRFILFWWSENMVSELSRFWRKTPKTGRLLRQKKESKIVGTGYGANRWHLGTQSLICRNSLFISWCDEKLMVVQSDLKASLTTSPLSLSCLYYLLIFLMAPLDHRRLSQPATFSTFVQQKFNSESKN